MLPMRDDDDAPTDYHEVELEEYRRRLDKEFELSSQLDEGVLWVARSILIVLGVFVSIVSVGGFGILQNAPPSSIIFRGLALAGLLLQFKNSVDLYYDAYHLKGVSPCKDDIDSAERDNHDDLAAYFVERYKGWVLWMEKENSRQADKLGEILFGVLVSFGLVLIGVLSITGPI